MWTLFVVVTVGAFAAGALCGPMLRVWVNGAEAEISRLRDRARQIEIALHLADKTGTKD